MPARLGDVAARHASRRAHRSDGVGQETPFQEGWYTEAQAIWVTTQSRTETAIPAFVAKIAFEHRPDFEGGKDAEDSPKCSQ